MVLTLWIAFGGALGTVARSWIALWAHPISRSSPWCTILIDVRGLFATGLFGTSTLAHGRHPVPQTARLFFMAGVCGGFTTFASFSLPTLDFLRAGARGRALASAAVSVLLCLGAVALGHTAGVALNGGAVQIARTVTEDEAMKREAG